MASSRRRDLSEEQCAALRPLVERLCEPRGGQARLAEATGWDQANISLFMRGAQGVSYAVALKICELANEDAFDLLKLPRPLRLRSLDMPVDEFLARVAAARGLTGTLVEHPRRWRLSTVAQALRTPHATDEQGVPIGGWGPLLDRIQPSPANAEPATEAMRHRGRKKGSAK